MINSPDNSYAEFTLLDIKFCCTLAELNFRRKTVNCKVFISLFNFIYILCHKQWFKYREIALFWQNTKKYIKKTLSKCNLNFVKINFDVRQTCKILPTKNCSIWNFPASPFVYILIKSLAKASKLFKMIRRWHLKKTEKSNQERFAVTYNQ